MESLHSFTVYFSWAKSICIASYWYNIRPSSCVSIPTRTAAIYPWRQTTARSAPGQLPRQDAVLLLVPGANATQSGIIIVRACSAALGAPPPRGRRGPTCHVMSQSVGDPAPRRKATARIKPASLYQGSKCRISYHPWDQIRQF